MLTLGAIILDCITLTFHIILVAADPGYIVNNDIDFMKLLELFDSSSLCPECHTIRTPRSRHCIICHSCVDRYDHHCPWINNCVGIRNHNMFISYLFFQFMSLVVSIFQTIQLTYPCFISGNFDEIIDQDGLFYDNILYLQMNFLGVERQ